MFKFGKRSESLLTPIHPQLVRVERRALQKTPIDFGILWGARTPQEQSALYAQGRNPLNIVNNLRRAANLGPISETENKKTVTNTMKSNHLVNSHTGYGHAIDFGVYVSGVYMNGDNQAEVELYKAVADIHLVAAKELGIPIVAGALWKQRDWGHIELDPKVYG